MPDLDRLAGLRDRVAVVGVGETDYVDDYVRSRRGEAVHDSYGLAALAFRRALADSELGKESIDGLVVGPTIAYERMAEILGLNPRWGSQSDAGLAVHSAVLAISSGLCETVALIYGNAQRSGGVQYGGPQAMGGDNYLAYVYYAPWGMTSQGALYALMFRRYQHVYGVTPEQLGRVAVAQRKHAALNERAIMRDPITIEDYLNSRFIVAPLHVYDYCLINDGGVALILTTAERARDLAQPPVLISGIGRAELNAGATSLRPRLRDFYLPAQRLTADQVYSMAGLGPTEIDTLQVYDSFSCHVFFALDGFGFCRPGEAGDFLAGGRIEPGGSLPVNTSGGHLSESYMQGWNHQVEAVRQARGTAGARQVADCRHVQYISDVAGKVVSIIYRKDDR